MVRGSLVVGASAAAACDFELASPVLHGPGVSRAVGLPIYETACAGYLGAAVGPGRRVRFFSVG